jgi:hypothetical protein
VERRQGLARLWPAVVLGVALLVVLVALVTGKMMIGHEGALAVQVASEGLVSGDSAERSLAPPSVEPRSNLSNLEAVFYSLSGSEVTPGGQPTKGGASIEKERRPAAQAQTSGSEERQGAPKQQETPRSGGSATSREVVNTEGPIEGAEFRKGLEARNPRAPRLPEALPDSKPAQPQGGGYPEVGGVVLGEVKSVIVATSVLDKPSYQARILSRLHEGDKVSVEARVGRWVRIRSRRGKTGYVFAQDVGEPEDFIASEATP